MQISADNMGRKDSNIPYLPLDDWLRDPNFFNKFIEPIPDYPHTQTGKEFYYYLRSKRKHNVEIISKES